MARRAVKKAMHAPDFLNEPAEYHKAFSRGIKVNLGNFIFLFISGTASVDKRGKTFSRNNFPAQVRRTFENLKALLLSEGAAWHDVVQTRCYLKNMDNYAEFNELRNRFYKKEGLNPCPASTCIEANLCRKDLLVEIEAIAVLSRKK